VYSRAHAVLSVLTGVCLVGLTRPPDPLVVVAVAVGVGVGIDFDHFAIAWLNTGSAKNVRRVLTEPRLAVTEQTALFDDGDLTAPQRLLSHVLLGGVAVTALWLVALDYWALVVGASLYVHVVADLYADIQNVREQ